MKIGTLCLALAISILCFSGDSLAQGKKLKIHISADIKGVVGVVTDAQLGPSGFEYQRARELMTEEVISVNTCDMIVA